MTNQTTDIRLAMAEHKVMLKTQDLRVALENVKTLAEDALRMMSANEKAGRPATYCLNTLGVFQSAAPEADQLVATLHLYEDMVTMAKEMAS